MIVIKSLVPGGVAEQDGRLHPGDRLMSVNETDLENSSLAYAVQTLKGTPKGEMKKKKYVMRICLNSNTTGDPSAQWDSKSSTRVKLSFNEVHLRFSFMLEVLRWIWLEGREVFEVFENVLLNFRSSKNWSCQASSWRLWRRRRNWRESSRLCKGQCWSNAGKWCARKAKRKWVFFSVAYC